MKTKVCRLCGLIKRGSDYYTHTATSDGLRTECKDCAMLTQRKRRKIAAKEKVMICNWCQYEFKFNKSLRKFCSIECRNQSNILRDNVLFKRRRAKNVLAYYFYNYLVNSSIRYNIEVCYIKGKLKKLGLPINNETIEVYKITLQLKRALYEKQRQINSSRSDGSIINLFSGIDPNRDFPSKHAKHYKPR